MTDIRCAAPGCEFEPTLCELHAGQRARLTANQHERALDQMKYALADYRNTPYGSPMRPTLLARLLGNVDDALKTRGV